MAKTADLISENFFEAIQTIVNAELKNISYDKTIVCTVTRDDKRSEGQYTVTDGSVEFDAYSETTEYRVGDEVLVTILLGDFSQAKTIVRRYTKDNTSDPVVYVPPLGTMLDMTDNLAQYGAWQSKDVIGADTEAGEPYSILANGPTNYKCIWAIDFDSPDNKAGLDIKLNSIYSVLGLTASFKTLLGAKDYNIRDGLYGLMLSVEYTSLPGQEAEHSSVARYVLDSRYDMFGDPYNYLTYFVQLKKIDISKLGTIHKINLFLYLTGTFGYSDGEHKELIPLPHTTVLNGKEIDLPDNIWVTNISLSFGYDIISMRDNEVLLYTEDGPTFTPKRVNDPYNEKSIYMLWCNKDENNEYVGFSDGIYDPGYDEDTYSREFLTKQDALTLKNHTMETKCPPILEALLIYANADKLNDTYLKIADYYTTNVAELLRYLRGNLSACGLQTELIDEMVPMYSADNEFRAKLLSAYAAIDNAANLRASGTGIRPQKTSRMVTREYLIWFFNLYEQRDSENYYFNGNVSILDPYDYSVNQYWNGTHTGVHDTWGEARAEIETMYKTLLDDLELINIRAYIEKSLMNMIEVLDTIERIMITARNYIDPQKSLIELLILKFIDKNLVNIDEEYILYVEANVNKYCIYWYRYNKDVKTSDDAYKGLFWTRLTDFGGGANGLPTEYEEHEDGIQYYVKRPDDAKNGPRDIKMNTAVATELFLAVIIYNHHPYYSNIITFENEEPIIDTTTADATDSIYIELSNNAQASYLLYGVDNVLQNIADRSISRKLRLRYKGQNWGDEALLGTTVFWYIPTNSTMLSWKEDTEKKKTELETVYNFTRLSALWDEELFPDYSNAPDDYVNYHKYIRPGYECWYKIIGPDPDKKDEFGLSILNEFDTYFSYTIKDYFNPTATQNTIRVLVLKELAELEAEYSFSFATFGTSGTDYSVIIHPNTSQGSIIHVTTEDNVATELLPLPVTVEFYDYDNKLVNINWNNNDRKEGDPRVPTLQMYKPVVMSITHYGDPAKGTFLIDASPTYDKLHGYGNLYTVLEATVPWDTLGVNKAEDGSIDEIEADLTLDLKALYAVPYSSGYYYIEGPSTIIYDANGQNPNYYKDICRLYSLIDDKEIEGIEWKMMYFQDKPDTNLLVYVDLSLSVEDDEERRKRKLILQYLPTITFNKQKGGYVLNPVHMYISNVDYYCVLIAVKGEKLLYSLPLVILQNRYSSDMINKWDESLVIDEENGTILSTMVGAGSKDDLNRFSGVLMGDVRMGTDDATLDMIGIYGYHEGGLSFGFKADGTAFIGKSGLGRIIFDGNDGYILNSTFTYTVNGQERQGAGMRIDLNDGIITMRGTAEDDKSLTNYTNSEIILQTKSPYFTIRDEGGMTLSTSAWSDRLANIKFYEKSDEPHQNSLGEWVYDYTPADGKYLNQTTYIPGKFYYKDNGLYLMWIGHDEYYLKSHDFPDASVMNGSFHLVETPSAEAFAAGKYYEIVQEYVIDSDNILPTLDGDTLRVWYIKDSSSSTGFKEIIMRPRAEFTQRRGVDLYTSMVLDGNSTSTSGRLYYEKDENDAYIPVRVDYNFFDTEVFYEIGDPPNLFVKCERPEYQGNVDYYELTSEGTYKQVPPDRLMKVDINLYGAFYDGRFYYKDLDGYYIPLIGTQNEQTQEWNIPVTYESLLADEELLKKYGSLTLYLNPKTTLVYRQVPNDNLGILHEPPDGVDVFYRQDGWILDLREKFNVDDNVNNRYQYFDNSNPPKPEDFGYIMIFDANWDEAALYGTGEGWFYKRGEDYVLIDDALVLFNPFQTGDYAIYYREKVTETIPSEDDSEDLTIEYYEYHNIIVYRPGYYYYRGVIYVKVPRDELDEAPINQTYYTLDLADNYREYLLWEIFEKALENTYIDVYTIYNGIYRTDLIYYLFSLGLYIPIALTPSEFLKRDFDIYTHSYEAFYGIYDPTLTYYYLYEETQYESVSKDILDGFLINNYSPGTYWIQVPNFVVAEEWKIDGHYYRVTDWTMWYFTDVGNCIDNPFETNKFYYDSLSINNLTLIPKDDTFLSSTPYYLEIDGRILRVYFYENNKYYILRDTYKKATGNFVASKLYFTRWASSGIKLDLYNGLIEGYNIKFEAHGAFKPSEYNIELMQGLFEFEEGDFIIDTTVPEITNFPLQIGNNFKVAWSGWLQAMSGNIGGWLLLENRFESNGGLVGMASYTLDVNTPTGALIDGPVFWATSLLININNNTILYSPYERITNKYIDGSNIGYQKDGIWNTWSELKDDWKSHLDFYVTRNGEMKATKGTIAGWKIFSDKLLSEDNTVTIDKYGNIKGATITVTKGTIGGWIIDTDRLKSPNGLVYMTYKGVIHGASITSGTITGTRITTNYLYATGGTINGLNILNLKINGTPYTPTKADAVSLIALHGTSAITSILPISITLPYHYYTYRLLEGVNGPYLESKRQSVSASVSVTPRTSSAFFVQNISYYKNHFVVLSSSSGGEVYSTLE